ncbi:MAG: FAD-dependent oxidoreductase [Verrucomicrobiota bacterium]|nr:FAD-dependent oxidoreductase [Verrucomicrobiota bacterium]
MSTQKGSGLYNVVVIGAGTAGLVTAAGTASLGGRVALIERHKMGGDCLNFGCVPSKALISSARLAQRMREAEKWGLRKQEPQFEFRDVMERMRSRRAKIAPNDSQERFESLGVDVFRGEARFISPHEVEVDGQRLRARNFVIATGSRASIPKIGAGTAVALAGAIIGATFAFLRARYLGRERVNAATKGNKNFAASDTAIGE